MTYYYLLSEFICKHVLTCVNANSDIREFIELMSIVLVLCKAMINDKYCYYPIALLIVLVLLYVQI